MLTHINGKHFKFSPCFDGDLKKKKQVNICSNFPKINDNNLQMTDKWVSGFVMLLWMECSLKNRFCFFK